MTEAEQQVVLRRELREIFDRIADTSGEFINGLYAGLEGVEHPVSRHEAGTTGYDEFHEGYDAGLRTKRFIETGEFDA